MLVRVTVVCLLSLFLNSIDASATVFTADPDSVFTDPSTAPVINTAFSGVILSGNSGQDVLALGGGVTQVPGWAPAVFGHGAINFPGGACSGCWSFGFITLKASFSSSNVTQVDVDFIDRFAGTAILETYDQTGSLIQQITMTMVGNAATQAQRITLSVSSTNTPIAYILAGADNGTSGVIDLLKWTTGSKDVPEPVTLTLILVSLFGIGVVSIRQRTG